MSEQLARAASPPRANGRLDAGALGALFDRHGALAYGVAIRLMGDPTRAEDVVCDAFVRLAQGGDVSSDHDGIRRRIIAAVVSSAMRGMRTTSADAAAQPPGRTPVTAA